VISPEEARELAAPHWGAVSGEMEIEEFDLGYVAWRREPPPEDPTIPPSTVGGTLLVIDKETGEMTTWPNRSSMKVIEQYRRFKRGESTRV
jgi:hypothetical protein